MFSVQYSVFSFLIVFNTFFLRKPFLPSNSPIHFPLWGLGGCPTILSSCKDLTQKASAFSVQYSVFSFLIVFNTFFLRKPFLPSNSPIHFPLWGLGGFPQWRLGGFRLLSSYFLRKNRLFAKLLRTNYEYVTKKSPIKCYSTSPFLSKAVETIQSRSKPFFFGLLLAVPTQIIQKLLLCFKTL